jgi:DNA-directed RNA polymerase specialized sigma24 family protein
MRQRGQTTTFQTRLEISEYASADLKDTQIAAAVGCSVLTVHKWRRRANQQGRVGLAKPMDRPATGEVEHLSS